jgi:hypothetical protein
MQEIKARKKAKFQINTVDIKPALSLILHVLLVEGV